MPCSTNTCIMLKYSLALCATLTTISSLNSPHRLSQNSRMVWLLWCVHVLAHTHKLGKIWGHAPLGKFEKLGTLRLEVKFETKVLLAILTCSSTQNWWWALTQRRCLNSPTIPVQAPTPDLKLADRCQRIDSHRSFAQASPKLHFEVNKASTAVEKAVSCLSLVFACYDYTQPSKY